MDELYLSDNIIDYINIISSNYNSISIDKSYYINSLYNKYILDNNNNIYRIIYNDSQGNILISNNNMNNTPALAPAFILKVGTRDFDYYKVQEVINVASNTPVNLYYQVIDEKTNYPLNLTNFTGQVTISRYLSNIDNFTFSPVVYSKGLRVANFDPVIYTSSSVTYNILYQNESNPFFQLPSSLWTLEGVMDNNNETISVEDRNIIPLQYVGGLNILSGIGGIINLSVPQIWYDPNFNINRNVLITPGIYVIEFKFIDNSSSKVYNIQLRFNVIQSFDKGSFIRPPT